MNETEIESAIQRLPLSQSERRAVIGFATKPRVFLLFCAVSLAAIAAVPLTDGIKGYPYARHRPAGGNLVPIAYVYEYARQAEQFYFGVIGFVLAVVCVGEYYAARRRYRLAQLLVSCATKPKVA